MKPWSIRLLLVGVSAAVLVLPALALMGLRSYTGYLVRRTEEQLLGQAVLISETYKDAWLRESGAAGPPTTPPTGAPRYAPIAMLAETINDLTPPEPSVLPAMPNERRATAAYRAGRSIEPLLRRAQVFNLNAVRVLDAHGCVVATTRGDAERCLTGLPEVERALRGRYAAVLRARISDEPPPPLSSIRRRGDQRLFIALPVRHEGQLLGVVRLSRTAESGLEWVWKNRRSLLASVALVIAAALGLSFVCARLIARPLQRMAAAAAQVTGASAPWPREVVHHAPRELAVLGAALEAMTQRLAARATYVSEFAANVSHELKTPLTSIRGAAELLRDSWSTMPEAQRERFLANIQADAERTEALVGGLLHLARVENSSPSGAVEDVDLGRIAAAIRVRYPEHVSVQTQDDGLRVTLPQEHVFSVIGNLVENALRYRRVQPVRVQLNVEAERLRITVEDDGVGISAANLPRVFDRFFTTERDRGGTGLGLSIVRAVAESRGGTAVCQSGPGWTRFVVTL